MRPYGLMSLALLTACGGEASQNNSVDVSAAARRAEADIADYAAQRRAPSRKQRDLAGRNPATTPSSSAGSARAIMPGTVAGRRDSAPPTVAK